MNILRKLIRSGLATLVLLSSATAQASLTVVGNTAPGNRVIDVEVDGQLAAQRLGYLEFREIDLAPGNRNIRMLDTFTSAPLAQITYLATSSNAGWVSLGGDGGGRPFSVVRGFLLGALNDTGGNLGIVNAAVDVIDYTLRCEYNNGFNASTGGSSPTFGSVGYSVGDFLGCRLDASTRANIGPATALPALQVEFRPGEPLFVARVGNGTASAPFQWIEVRHGAVSPATPAAEQDLLRVMKSVHFWYDSGRYSQGVTLYEVSRTQAVNGLWMTYATGGRPQWMYLDGGVVDASGRREVVVSDYHIDANGQRTGTTVGRGVLTYIDCNNAEFQVQFADGSTRAAQFRRSIPVSTCVAVP